MADAAVCHEEVTDAEGMILGACEQPAIARRLDPEDGHAYPVCAEHAVGPLRVQQRRTKGWRKPEGAVAVGRGTRWGNPYRVVRAPAGGTWFVLDRAGRPLTEVEAQEDGRREAVDLYRAAVSDGRIDPGGDPWFTSDGGLLRGKDLMCWCPLDQPCHADVLLELANREDGRG